MGLIVVPVTGKTPAAKGWRQWKGISQQTIKTFAQQFPDANVGIVTGQRSRITVVDVDDLDIVGAVLNRFGPTPLRIRSGSGHSEHLYYRFAGERCHNLRKIEGLPVDIKGEGGFVLAPPSIHPDTGAIYDFLAGSWADLRRLPALRPNSLMQGARRRDTLGNVFRLGAVEVGVRNNTLFGALLRQARYCDDIEALRDVAFTINDYDFKDPLPSAEVEKTLKSAWRYQSEGRNWADRKGAMVQMSRYEVDTLALFPDAFVFLAYLRCCHGRSQLAFAISPKAMADAQSVPGWADPRRYRRAREKLIKLGFLECVQKGGSGPGDPHLFRFSIRVH